MRLTPRYYQQEAFDAAVAHMLKTDEPGILELATGAGKSIIIAMLADWLAAKKRRVLVLTDSSDLVQQNHAKYLMTGNDAGIFSAKLGKKQHRHQVIFAGIQSVARNLSKFDEAFSLVIVDECHMVASHSGSYQKVFAHLYGLNPKMRVIGLTATPSRGKYRLVSPDNFFKHTIYRKLTKDLIEEGFLVPIVYGAPSAEEYQLAGLKLNSMGKFNQHDVDNATLGQERLTRAICTDIMANMYAQHRQLCMIFAASIQHAKEIVSYLPAGLTEIVTGETSQKERDEILEAARIGPIQYLVNVGTLTKGVDIPRCDCIALLRATESPALLAQIIGRGLRLSPETGKTDCLLLDFGQNIDRHGEAEDDIFGDLEDQKAKAASGDETKVCPECGNDSGLMARRCKHKTGWNDEVCGYRFEFKTCPGCNTENDITARYCWHCQHELVNPNDKLTNRASGGARSLENLAVVQVVLMPHIKDSKTLLRADYTVQHDDGSTLVVSEYFHEQHESPFVVLKYRQFLQDIGAAGSIDDVLARDGYAGPERVSLKKNGKYYNVLKRHIGTSSPVTVHQKGKFQWH